MKIDLPVISGVIATALFALSTLPMVVKAYRTKDLKSYSLGYLLLGNAGNLFYSIYVYNLPPSPIWLLHSFYLVVTGLMLFWYLHYEFWPRLQQQLRDRKMQDKQRPQSRNPLVRDVTTFLNTPE